MEEAFDLLDGLDEEELQKLNAELQNNVGEITWEVLNKKHLLV